MTAARNRYAVALLSKRTRFIEEYLKDLNATQAARRAGYSAKSAKQQGTRLLSYAAVKAEIRQRQAARAEKLEISQTSILGEIAKMGFASLADFMRVDTNGMPVIDMSAVSKAKMDGLSGISIRHGGKRGRNANTVQIRLAKLEALRMLGEHLGMFDKAPIIPPVDPMDEHKRNETVAAVLKLLGDLAHGRLVRPTVTIEQAPRGNGHAQNGGK